MQARKQKGKTAKTQIHIHAHHCLLISSFAFRFSVFRYPVVLRFLFVLLSLSLLRFLSVSLLSCCGALLLFLLLRPCKMSLEFCLSVVLRPLLLSFSLSLPLSFVSPEPSLSFSVFDE